MLSAIKFSRFGFMLSFSTLFVVLGNVCLNGEDVIESPVAEELPLIEQVSVSFYGGWDSHYFTEGRDNLDGGSLLVNDLQASWGFLYSQIWYVASPGQSYDELQIIMGVTQSIDDFTWYAGYTHLQFPSDDLNDDEASVGISVSNLPAGLQLAFDAYHSFEADGFFAEFSVSRGFALTDSLSIIGTGILGMNQGYISDGHDGANHFALAWVCSYQVNESISIIARVAQSWAIRRDSTKPGDDALVDLFNGGIGVQWSL